uniref:Complement component C6-like n=1 Tax=Acanthochromis polyacanthus TaxID=80966 RepID=A0A3Q1EX49_9TELE
MFMGGSCIIKRPRSTLLYHRVPYNFKDFEIKVVFGVRKSCKVLLIFSAGSFLLVPRLFYLEVKYRQMFCIDTFGDNIECSALTLSNLNDSKFFRVHQILPVSTFKVKEPGDLVLSLPFRQFLHALPLEYNYALYREIFQRFGTHYYSSGTLGGHYDLLYHAQSNKIPSYRVLLNACCQLLCFCIEYNTSAVDLGSSPQHFSCPGSYIQSAEKSFSMVKGGRTREAAALAWERQGAAPDRTSYKNWAKSVLENPALLPIIDLVRGIPCAATKRRHLRKALLQYLEEFDTCKCAPCPNNARPVLSGTECKCVCQTGTFGTNCEKRAVDGYWSCWGPWSRCSASMKRHRTRSCNNPAPLRRGQPCNGPSRQEEACHISIFQTYD